MANLDKQSKQFCCVIRKNKHIAKARLVEFCSQVASQWAFIVHKDDINREGVVEGEHQHLVLLLPKRKRGYTLLNEITTFFNFDNNFGIEVDIMQSLEGSIQYLTHKNEKDKTPHDFEEIESNLDEGELKTLYECVNNSLTFDRIYQIVIDSNDIVEVIKAVGFTRYNMYRNTIRDIYNWVKLKKE